MASVYFVAVMRGRVEWLLDNVTITIAKEPGEVQFKGMVVNGNWQLVCDDVRWVAHKTMIAKRGEIEIIPVPEHIAALGDYNRIIGEMQTHIETCEISHKFV